MTPTAWKPLLTDDLAREARAAVEAIAADLATLASLIAPFGPDPERSLGRGSAGAALFFSYLEQEPVQPDPARVWNLDTLARSLAERAARDPEEEGTGLCDGVAGTAHLLNRLAQVTGDERTAGSARAAFRRLLAMRRPHQGIGGFQARLRDGQGRVVWADDPGFRRGSSGIGLALLAAVSTVEPAWDRLLLTR